MEADVEVEVEMEMLLCGVKPLAGLLSECLIAGGCYTVYRVYSIR
jgi:hypothetical protein